MSENSIHPLLPFPKKKKTLKWKNPFSKSLSGTTCIESVISKVGKKKQNKKNLTPEQRSLKEKREERCWIRLFSMLFRNYSSKELKKFKKLWKFCVTIGFLVIEFLHAYAQKKYNIPCRNLSSAKHKRHQFSFSHP